VEFEKYVCWHKQAVESYLNIEAVRSDDDHVFLATHHPVKMTRHALRDELFQDVSEDRSPYAEEELLREFLEPQDVCRVAVLGETGTGKSHLVRWLATRIPSTADREVLLIRREGSNLRSILERVLGLPGLEGEEIRRYRERLRQAASGLTTAAQAREKLLYNLAVACGLHGPHNNQNLRDAQQELVPGIQDYLTHPILRPYFTRPNGVLDQLVGNTLGLGESRPGEVINEQRGFTAGDLPTLKLADTRELNEQVLKFYNKLQGTPGLKQHAIQWMNQQLNSTAIAELLELKGDELFKMMQAVRRLLRQANGGRGRELVLLIEDLARMQGVDKQLLDALVVPPDNEYCRMRVALGCTTGYFRGLPETGQGRFDFYVRLDLKASGRLSMSAEEVEQFAARYLNAVRLDERKLKEWYARSKEDGDESPPCACEACRHKESCHNAFKERDGIGLYPLTPTALGRMVQRVSPGSFNPREVINRLLKAVLKRRKELSDGRFPSPALHEHFGGSKLKADVNEELKQKERDAEQRKRRAALLDLWTNGTRVVNLNPVIHKAFALPPLPQVEVSVTPPPQPEKATPAPTPKDELPPEVRERLEALDRWQNSEPPGNRLVKDLRDFVFSAIRQHVNWDVLPLLPRLACSNESRLFRKRSILLDGMEQEATRGFRIELKLPLPGQDRTEAARALQALVLFEHHGHWNFPEGNVLARRLACQLERWAEVVLQQVRRPRDAKLPWDPVPALAEVLTLTACLAGRPPGVNLAEQVDALFVPDGPGTGAGRSLTWRQLLATLLDRQETLRKLLLAHVPCTRGGSPSVQVIDASRLAGTLEALKQDLRPRAEVPTDLWETYRAVREAREAIDRDLSRALAEEKQRYLDWHAKVRQYISADQSPQQVIAGVTAAVMRARDEGVFGLPSAVPLNEAGPRFSQVDFPGCVEAAEQGRPLEGPSLLPLLGIDRSEALAATEDFLAETEKFIDTTERRVQDERRGQGSGQGVSGLHKVIGELLEDLESLTGSLAGGPS
jgi:hypothetical protein